MSFQDELIAQVNASIARVNEIDALTGDEGSSARQKLNEMVRQNPSATSKAKEIIRSIDELEDDNMRLLVARVLSTEGNKIWKGVVDAWIEDNKVESTAPAISDEEKVALLEERAKEIGKAKALSTALETMDVPKESLPTIPQGRRGNKGGKRGPMVRGYNFTMDDNEKMIFTTFGNVIKAAQSNQAAAREALAAQGLDIAKLPTEWKFTLNSHSINAFSKDADEPDLDDDEDEDDSDFEDDDED